MQIATQAERTSFVDGVKLCETFSKQLPGAIVWMQNVDSASIKPVEEFLTTSSAVMHLFVVLCVLLFIVFVCAFGDVVPSCFMSFV